LQYKDVNQVLLNTFPNFIIDDEDIALPYIVAGNFIRFLLGSYNNGKEEVYKEGLHFIEMLHLSDCHKVRELATVGYLESLLDWPYREGLFNDLETESKKWWIELNLFQQGKIKYIGESFRQAL
jgi:hypothetical protein